MRDVEADPRVGDWVRVIPALSDAKRPAPLQVIEVTDRHVRWKRGDVETTTSRDFWRGKRIHGGIRRLRLELIEDQQP